jgi:hypothetical protein
VGLCATFHCPQQQSEFAGGRCRKGRFGQSCVSGGPGRMLLELFDREKLVVGPMLHRAQAYIKEFVELF